MASRADKVASSEGDGDYVPDVVRVFLDWLEQRPSALNQILIAEATASFSVFDGYAVSKFYHLRRTLTRTFISKQRVAGKSEFADKKSFR
jgi:hypothetical protein